MTDLSICMVSLNSWNVLDPCLQSLYASDPIPSIEVIIVDNASTDGTAENVAREYPDVRLIQNTRNVGFTKATNKAIEHSSGQYILWLNTDTILRKNSLYQLHQFLETYPNAGIVGPKVLNPDGTFQPQCRRGLPTPVASLFYLFKFHRLFPKNRRFSQYLLTHLPVEEVIPVDAVSGCCLLTRRQVWDDIGPLDPEIFGFGEDIDWCIRAKKIGWEVWYYPQSEIVHLKGQGGVHSKPYHKVWGIHQAMWIFYRKHLMSSYPRLVTVLIWLGIWTSFLSSVASVWLTRTIRSIFAPVGARQKRTT